MKPTAFILAMIFAAPASADIRVDFNEGAPKDRFTITNTASCALDALDVTLDLATAPAGLIFDVSGNGAGVEVFQPFELVAGEALVRAKPTVTDGQQELTLSLTNLDVDQSVAFTIDLDDTTSDRQITVSGAEIAGASVNIEIDGVSANSAFGPDATAYIALANCAS